MAGEVAINESLARALFGNADPIGRQLAMNPKEPMLTIVGVMKDARQISPRDRGLGSPTCRFGGTGGRRSPFVSPVRHSRRPPRFGSRHRRLSATSSQGR